MTSYDCCACGGAEGEAPCQLCQAEVTSDPCAFCPFVARSTNSELVGEFHAAFGVEEPTTPTIPDVDTIRLRYKLIREEFHEVETELDCAKDGDDNLANLAKELADLLVVTYGTARTFGIDIDAVMREVHRSNMSKLGADGKPVRREDGKILKGDGYTPADVESVLRNQ